MGHEGQDQVLPEAALSANSSNHSPPFSSRDSRPIRCENFCLCRRRPTTNTEFVFPFLSWLRRRETSFLAGCAAEKVFFSAPKLNIVLTEDVLYAPKLSIVLTKSVFSPPKLRIVLVESVFFAPKFENELRPTSFPF